MSQDLNKRVELKTERLLLRPFEFKDVEDVLGYASDPEVARYVPMPQPYTRDDAVEFVARQVLADWSSRPLFAIVFEHHVVGGIGLRINESHGHRRVGLRAVKTPLGPRPHVRGGAGRHRLGI